MEIIEIFGKTVGLNVGGREISTGLVARDRIWPIDQAGHRVVRREAVFLYRGEAKFELDKLPRVAGIRSNLTTR